MFLDNSVGLFLICSLSSFRERKKEQNFKVLLQEKEYNAEIVDQTIPPSRIKTVNSLNI